MVLPGLSESLATDWPLHSTSFNTMLSGVWPMSLVRLVPMPKLVLKRLLKYSCKPHDFSMVRLSLKVSILVRLSIFSFL